MFDQLISQCWARPHVEGLLKLKQGDWSQRQGHISSTIKGEKYAVYSPRHGNVPHYKQKTHREVGLKMARVEG